MSDYSFLKSGLLTAALFAAPVSTWADATLAQWTFEQSKPMDGGPVRPEVGEGQAIGHTTGVWTNPVGNGSGESWSSNQWAPGDYYQFMVNGSGSSAFDITWSQISSSTGPRDFALSYSLDGQNYVWLIDYVVIANATPNNWSFGAKLDSTRYGFELQFDHPCKGPVYFRITLISSISANGGAMAIGGASRIDDVAVAAVAP